MEPAALGAIASPQKHRSQDASNDGQARYIRRCSENMQSYTCKMGDKVVDKQVRPDSLGHDRVSTGSTASSGNELEERMRRRRQVVDKQGAHWESPSPFKCPNNLKAKVVVAKTLFPDDSTSTPEEAERCDEEHEPEHELQMTPPKKNEEDPSPPTRSSSGRTSRQKQMAAIVKQLEAVSDEQFKAFSTMTHAAAVMMGAPEALDSSNCSSSERGSEDSPEKKRIAASSAPERTRYYETAPQYQNLKRRSRGSDAQTPRKQVTFKNEEEELQDNGSGNDIPEYTSTINVKSLGVNAARRLSRGPTGEIRFVSHDDSSAVAALEAERLKDEAEEAEAEAETENSVEAEYEQQTFSEVSGAVVGGFTGAIKGGFTGAAVGVVPALFTFGLSIPVGAFVGATYAGYQGIVSNLSRGRQGSSESSNAQAPRARMQKSGSEPALRSKA